MDEFQRVPASRVGGLGWALRGLGAIAAVPVALTIAVGPARAQSDQGSGPGAGGAPTLALPLACTLGTDCWVQNYVDVDSGPGAKDYNCTDWTFDNLRGTDIRIRDRAAMDKGVAVLAPAAGTVLRTRDGEPDRTFGGPMHFTPGRNCGNGVVIDNGHGWQTMLCHMMKGSIAVHPGERVSGGQPVGKVGASGETEFPHVHVAVLHDGKRVDPFTGAEIGTAACGTPGTPLWRAGLFPDKPREDVILNVGFATGPVTMAAIENGIAGAPPTLPASVPALVFYGRGMHLRAGDRERISIAGPSFQMQQAGNPIPHDRAQQMMFTGKRAPQGGFKPGTYTGRYEIIRRGEVVSRQTAEVKVGG